MTHINDLQNLKASDFIGLFNANKKSIKIISFDFNECKDVEKDFYYLEIPQYTETNPLVVEDYPYGRLRTQIRYWIETTKNGDRFCSQTLNPKTLKWNNPKKSTYTAVKIMIADEKGHISTISMDYNDKEFNLKNKYEAFSHFLSKAQKIELAKVLGYTEVMKSVKFKFRQQEYRHKVTGEVSTQIDIMDLDNWEKVSDEEKDREQKEINNTINKAIALQSQRKFIDMK